MIFNSICFSPFIRLFFSFTDTFSFVMLIVSIDSIFNNQFLVFFSFRQIIIVIEIEHIYQHLVFQIINEHIHKIIFIYHEMLSKYSFFFIWGIINLYYNASIDLCVYALLASDVIHWCMQLHLPRRLVQTIDECKGNSCSIESLVVGGGNCLLLLLLF